VSISLKVSSSVFKVAGEKNDKYWFDQSGAQMPYSTFVSLMEDKTFTGDYMRSVREDYEKTEGSLTDENDDNGPDAKKVKNNSDGDGDNGEDRTGSSKQS
jgi:hypothetical protein